MSKQIVSYLVTGIATVLLSFGLYSLGLALGLSIVAANTVATLIAMVFAFGVQKYWVFRATSSHFVKEFGLFAFGRALTYGVETLLLVLLVHYLGAHPLGSKGATQLVVVAGNYLLSKWVIFR